MISVCLCVPAGAEGFQSECSVFSSDCRQTLPLCSANREGIVHRQLPCHHQHHCWWTCTQSAHMRSHELIHTTLNLSILTAACNSFFIMPAPSPVGISLVNKTTSSICISWSVIKGVVSGLILSIKNKTSNQELIVSHEEPRLVSLKPVNKSL